jgi:flagellar motility protein MotE (MotC chaperone)
MRLFALNRLLIITAATITVAMLLRIGTLITGAPTLEALRIEASSAVFVAGNTASASVMGQAQAARLPGLRDPGLRLVAAKTEATPAPAGGELHQSPAPAPASPSPASPSPASPPATVAAAPFVAPSDAEKALLEDLRGRRSQIETREQGLAQREATLGAAEKHLTDRVAELAGIEARLQGLEKSLKDHDEANWAGMVKLYESMRPRDAAAIFNSLEKPVLLELLDRMKPAKASPILAAMDTDAARQATAALAARRTQSTTLAN